MLKFIRLLGGALGVILAIALTGFDGTSATLLDASTEGRVLLAAWIAAWGVVGFAIAPYITVAPARWLMRAVTDMSTDEFVAAIIGLILGLLMGFLLGLPLTTLPSPAGLLLPIGVSIVLALGMMGLTVAKRRDLRDAIRELGVFRRGAAEAEPHGAQQAGDLPRHQRHHRRAHRRCCGLRLPVGSAGGAALRAR